MRTKGVGTIVGLLVLMSLLAACGGSAKPSSDNGYVVNSDVCHQLWNSFSIDRYFSRLGQSSECADNVGGKQQGIFLNSQLTSPTSPAAELPRTITVTVEAEANIYTIPRSLSATYAPYKLGDPLNGAPVYWLPFHAGAASVGGQLLTEPVPQEVVSVTVENAQASGNLSAQVAIQCAQLVEDQALQLPSAVKPGGGT